MVVLVAPLPPLETLVVAHQSQPSPSQAPLWEEPLGLGFLLVLVVSLSLPASQGKAPVKHSPARPEPQLQAHQIRVCHSKPRRRLLPAVLRPPQNSPLLLQYYPPRPNQASLLPLHQAPTHHPPSSPLWWRHHLPLPRALPIYLLRLPRLPRPRSPALQMLFSRPPPPLPPLSPTQNLLALRPPRHPRPLLPPDLRPHFPRPPHRPVQ